jgi:phosphopantothenoylcysteine decarboxylase/phosphopantothenate--cysteine ligase
VADYRVAQPSERKLKKGDQAMTLALVPTVDILARVAARPAPPFCVGFAAESHDLDTFAEDKRRRKRLPLLVGNVAQDAIGAQDSEIVLYDDTGRHPLPRAPKLEQARALVRHIARLYSTGRERREVRG